MPIAEIQLPNGKIAEIEVPEGATHEDILSFVSSNPGQFETQPTQPQTQGTKSSFFGVSDDQLQRNIQSASQSSQREKETVIGGAKGFAQGLGNALIGGVQAATDLISPTKSNVDLSRVKSYFPGVSDEQLQRNIQGASKPNAFQEKAEEFGGRLADQVGKLKEEQAKLPTEERVGIGIGEFAPYVGVGAGMGIVKGGAAASALASFLSPREEANLEKRTGKAIEAGAEGALYAGTLKLGGNIIGSEPVQKILGRTKEFATGLKDRLVSQFGSGEAAENASKIITEKTLKKGFEREGVNAKELLENLQKNDHDLIDALDPRFATYGKVKGALNTPENIKKVDASLSNIKQSTDDLQKSLTNMVATKHLTPEEAGEVLGRNAKKIFDRAQEARRLRVEPIYAKGLNSGTKLDINSQIAGSDLTLDQILKSNLGQNLLKTARGQSESFVGTPGEKFYGKISEKTKSGDFKIPDNDVRTLYAMENVLADRIGNVKLTGASKEEAALISTKKAISNLLDEANPDLKKARSYWSEDTKGIKAEGNSLIGKFAKMYEQGKTDDLAKASMNILDLPNRAIKLAKKSAPEDFNEILRSSIENRIAAIKPLDDSAIGSKPFYNALFEDGGKNLETALDNKEAFNGFKKLAVQLDRGQARQRLAKGAMESEAKAVNIATGKTSFINRVLEKSSDMLLNSPKANAKLVDFALTDEGLKMLGDLAKDVTPKEAEKTLLKIFTKSGLITKDDVYRALAIAGGKNDLIDIFPNETNLKEE